MRGLQERSASAERMARAASEAVGALHEEVKRCAAEAAASTSSAKLAARASARSQQLAKELGGAATRNDATDSMEQRLRTLEEAHMASKATAPSPAAAEQGCAVEVRAQVAALERQVGHLRDVSVEASRNVEQDQATLRALLRASRLLAERLGVGPVLLGRDTTGSLAAEAEGLASGVCAAWRRQKASGAIPAGAGNILEALILQRAELGSPRRPSIDEAPAPKLPLGMPRAGLRRDPSSFSAPLEARCDGMLGTAALDQPWCPKTCDDSELHN